MVSALCRRRFFALSVGFLTFMSGASSLGRGKRLVTMGQSSVFWSVCGWVRS